MNQQIKKAIIFAPFWKQMGHVGNNRIERFLRWLVEDGYYVVMVRAGSRDGERNESWGREITICDRLGFHRDEDLSSGVPQAPRKPNKLRRAVANWVFTPDPIVVWALEAAMRATVVAATRGAAFIISSSPPESAHVGAWRLSRNTGVPYIVDMRDGWLDEPLKPLLRTSVVRRWLEGRIEKKILTEASLIQVTSNMWLKLLCDRFPQFMSKVRVLTNGYPPQILVPTVRTAGTADGESILIHAGRFTGSRLTQSPHLLLHPLLRNLSSEPSKGTIQLIGNLSNEEINSIRVFESRFQELGWSIQYPGSMPRSQLLSRLSQANGLLVLSASYAALPSKIFEYIPTGLPIYVVTTRGSATFELSKLLPQATVCTYLNDVVLEYDEDTECDTSFLSKSSYSIPAQFSESSLASSFLNNCSYVK